MTSPFGTVLANVRTHLSTYTSIQTLTGTTTGATGALDHIFLWAAPPVATTPPPRFILDINSLDEEYRASSFQGIAGVEIRAEIPVPAANAATEHDQKNWFMTNVVDALLNDIETDTLGDGGLQIQSRSMTLPPGLVDSEELPGALEDMVLWIWQHQLNVMTL